ncbi:MAG: DUF1043 family protein [Gammaproteobacteria bacterium]|nr:DUF1043 family protein [Gammaproteobacteria bacterium]
MYSLAWLVVVGVVGAILGGWLGHLVARVRSKAAARIQELEAELESARGESSEYRREVFDQFAETARKFRSLDESYNDLHRQLAASASLLCGESAGPLLEAPPAPSAIAEAPEVPVAETPVAEQPVDVPVEEPAKGAEESAAAQADEEVPILVAEVDGAAQVNGEETASDEPADELQPRRAGDAA